MDLIKNLAVFVRARRDFRICLFPLLYIVSQTANIDVEILLKESSHNSVAELDWHPVLLTWVSPLPLNLSLTSC